MVVFMSAWQVRAIALENYPDWANFVDFMDAEAHSRIEWKNGRARQFVEYSVTFHHRKLADSRTVVARSPQGFANKIDRLFEAWNKQSQTSRRTSGVRPVSPGQQGSTRGARYVQVVYIDDTRDAAEIDIAQSIRHNGLRKPHRGEKNLQRAYVYRWPFAHNPQRGNFVIGTGTLALVTRLSRSGSDYKGPTVDLDAYIGGDARTFDREQLIALATKYPRGSLDDDYYSGQRLEP